MTSIFDIIVLGTLAGLGFLGLRNGLIDELATLIGFSLAIIFSSEYYSIGAALVMNLFRVNESFGAVLGYIVVFFAIYLVFKLIAWVIQSFVKMVKLEWLNKIAGLCFGAFKGFLLMGIVVWIISVFNEFKLEQQLSQKSMSYGLLKDFTTSAARFFHYDDDLEKMAHSIRTLFGLEGGKNI
ncbi:MAG: CvpA family protein [Candidatus Marinimicrobia bacterium]|nr:CvpA family protein [Candidatus Neomarinimicrobiota bacterium]